MAQRTHSTNPVHEHRPVVRHACRDDKPAHAIQAQNGSLSDL